MTLMRKNTVVFLLSMGCSLLVLSSLRAQDAKIVADNLEYSREFYSGVHFSAIAESEPSFGYQRYPDDGPERIQCNAGTFARQHGKPWLRSEDWGQSGRPVDQQMARKLDGWVKLVETTFDFTPNEVKLVKKSREGVRVEWLFEARTANQKGAPVRLRFGRPLYDKSPNALLHGFEGSLPDTGGIARERVKFSFGHLIAASGFELSEAAWEDLETPKELESKPTDLTKIDMGPKPDDAEGFLNRAGARGFNGDMNGAIADLSRAIDLDPKSKPAVYRRGAFKLQKEDYDGAIADLSRAIELSPNTADYYSDRGLAKLRKRDNDGALADYNGAINLDPKNAGAFNSRGVIKKSKGDLDGAIADFTKAIELNDKLGIAYKNRGEAKQAKGDAADAKEDLKRAGELDPELMSKESVADSSSNRVASASPAPSSPGRGAPNLKQAERYYESGLKKQDEGDLDGAIADFTRAIELDSQYAHAYYNRGNVREAKGDHDGAITDYDRAIELDPKYAYSYNNRGNAKKAKGDFDGAIADFTRAIELAPQDARFYYSRAGGKFSRGDFDGAIADLDRVIELNGKEPVPYTVRGDLYAKKNQYSAAIKDVQKAIKLDPKNGNNYLSLARYQLFNRKPREAIAASLEALKLSPDKAVIIKTKLAHGYLFDNQFNKAKAIYLENKNAKLRGSEQTFSQVVLDDFKQFQDAGITHP